MGEYYLWANPRRREFISHAPFEDFGFMMSCASAQPCTTTDAACTMIATAWHGDPVVFVGDYWDSFPPRDESGRRISALFDGYPYEDVICRFSDVTGHFPESRGKSHPGSVLVSGDDEQDVPYDGPYDLDVRHFRFAVSETRHEFVDRGQAPVQSVYQVPNGNYCWFRTDPIPTLFSPDFGPDGWCGHWCLDLVNMTDVRPEHGYRDVTLDALQPDSTEMVDAPRVTATDEVIAEVTGSEAFKSELGRRGIVAGAKGDGRLIGAVDAIGDLLRGRQ